MSTKFEILVMIMKIILTKKVSYQCQVDTVNGGFRVSVISVQTLIQASHSYQSQQLTMRRIHIGLNWIVLAQSYLAPPL